MPELPSQFGDFSFGESKIVWVRVPTYSKTAVITRGRVGYLQLKKMLHIRSHILLQYMD